MKRAPAAFVALAVALTAAAGVVALPGAGAATTTPVVPIIQDLSFPYPLPSAGKTDIYAVHGLNLAGQDAQADRGTPVTVCAGGSTLVADFQFGDIAGPVTLDTGATVEIKVFAGASQDCAGTSPLITQSVTVPATSAAALVATAGPGATAPSLQPVVLDVTTPPACVENGPAGLREPAAVVLENARLQAAHDAAAGQVDVKVNNTSLGQLAFGETLARNVVAGTYSVQVDLSGTAIVGPVDVTLAACEGKVMYVVGNQPVAQPTTTTTAPPEVAPVVTPAFTG
jgi:hypothetical protein